MIEECSQYRNNQTIVLVIPLLFEAKFEDICTEIWLVKCPKELQKNRLITRDKICLLYTSPSPRDRTRSRMPSSA